MGVRFPGSGSKTLVTGSLTGPGQFVIVTSPLLSQSLAGQLVLIQWFFVFTASGTAPIIAYELRRGALATDTLVNVSRSCTEVAGVDICRSGCYVDAPGDIGNVQYSLVANITSGGAASTARDAAIIALAL